MSACAAVVFPAVAALLLPLPLAAAASGAAVAACDRIVRDGSRRA